MCSPDSLSLLRPSFLMTFSLHGHVKLPCTDSDHQSIKGTTAYFDQQQLSRFAGGGLSHHILPDLFNGRYQGLNLGYSVFKADGVPLNHDLSLTPQNWMVGPSGQKEGAERSASLRYGIQPPGTIQSNQVCSATHKGIPQ